MRVGLAWSTAEISSRGRVTMKRVVLAVSLAFFAVACSNDRSITITEQNKDSVLDEIKDSKAFTPDDVRLLIARQMRVSVTQSLKQPAPDWVGKTLDQVIADERKVQEDAKAKKSEEEKLAAEAKAKEEAKAEELRKAISLTVFDKGFIPSDIHNSRYEDYITVKCAYQNLSDKDIRAFTGAVRFTDLFDKEILEIGITIENPVRTSEKATWDGTIKYNQFRGPHQALRNAEMANMKITWIPKSVIFADGTRLGAN